MSKKKHHSNFGHNLHNDKPIQSLEVVIKKKILGEAPSEQHFVVADGKRLKNIIDLADALETMTDDVFAYHANDVKNDFGNWIKDVFYEHTLAEDVSRAKNRLQTQIVLLRRLVKELI